ncbi:patatin-like phospholipase family protein [Azospirillum sp. Sh1]|uniref:patatin-like phospholipase family protein n=1 Tax=Azospirillum sp. Sh1 TaxID=2607285 RepID=UPI0011EDB424|nr:patatin-like phospholipase family protein [Azospirillum sp. Sh1]KAA0572619.1 hypothetical protein FZ029_23335 [Azospirillum sp. Sh1]
MAAKKMRSRRAILVFEGGGAKGLVHVGALRAIEELEPDILGVAGTSAGAILAALVAAGYRSEELFAPDGSHTILKDLHLGRATELFGDAWSIIRGFRWCLDHWKMLLAGLGTFFFLFSACVGWHLDRENGGLAPVFGVPLFMLTVIAVAVSIFRWLCAGLCSTDTFTINMDRALRRKIPSVGPKGRVCFKDLPRPLKIVATNLESGELTLFSQERTPQVAVADAVAASIAIPVIFSPKIIAGVPYYDGGLVSNLPAWTFDEERALDPDAHTIAIEIVENERRKDGGPTALLTPFHNLAAATRAALFGAGILNKRAAAGLYVLPIRTDVRVLDFDLGADQAAKVVGAAYQWASANVIYELETRPRLLRRACRKLHEVVVDLLKAGGHSNAGEVRVCLAMAEPGTHRSLRYLHCYNRSRHPDETLTVPIDGSLAGHVFCTGKPTFDAAPFTYRLAGDANRRLRRLLWRGMTWQLAIPIYSSVDDGHARPAMVLLLDGNGDASYIKGVLNDDFARFASSMLSELIDFADSGRPHGERQ